MEELKKIKEDLQRIEELMRSEHLSSGDRTALEYSRKGLMGKIRELEEKERKAE